MRKNRPLSMFGFFLIATSILLSCCTLQALSSPKNDFPYPLWLDFERVLEDKNCNRADFSLPVKTEEGTFRVQYERAKNGGKIEKVYLFKEDNSAPLEIAHFSWEHVQNFVRLKEFRVVDNMGKQLLCHALTYAADGSMHAAITKLQNDGELKKKYCYDSQGRLTCEKTIPLGLFSLPIDIALIKDETSRACNKFLEKSLQTITFAQGKLGWFFNFRNHFEDVAFKVMNKAFWTLVGYNPDPSASYKFGQMPASEKVRVTLINGILNAHSNVMGNAQLISELHGNVQVQYLYAASSGFTADLLRTFFTKVGFVAPEAKLLAVTWRELIKEMGGVNAGGRIIHYAHSLGGVNTYHALSLLNEEERKMIRVATFGSASLIGENDAASVVNYVSTRDAIPCIDAVKYVQGKLGQRKEIVFLESKNGIPAADHILTGDTYRTTLEELGRKFQEEYLKTELLAKLLVKLPEKKRAHKQKQAKEKPQTLPQKIKGQMQARNYALLGKTLAQVMGPTFTAKQLKEIAVELNCEQMKRALHVVKNILEKDRALGLKLGELVQLALFIETDFAKYKEQKKYYLRESVTGLSRIVEYDPKNKRTYIHLGEHGIPLLGAGCHKKVTKSILYDIKNPEVVANCRTTIADEKEMRFLEALQGTPGIVEGHSFIKHTSAQEQEDKLEIILKLYNFRTLRQAYYNQTITFTLPEKMRMALDLLTGLEKMHKKGIIHRDLHTGNYLVDVQQKKGSSKREVKVAITDFGGAIKRKECKGLQPQSFRWYIAPEGFFFENLEGEDYLYTDVYALGCVLYEVFYDNDPEWFDDKYFANLNADAMFKKVDQQKLAYLIHSSTQGRREALRIKKLTGSLTSEERFEALILRMVQISPKGRGKAWKLRDEMESIMKASIEESKRKIGLPGVPGPVLGPVLETLSATADATSQSTGISQITR